jgi:chemotaxis protein MotB
MIKMINSPRIWVFIFGICLLGSCVPSRKYDEVVAEKRMMQDEIDRLEKLEKDYYALEKDHNKLQEAYTTLEEELASCRKEYENLNNARKDLEEVYDKIVLQNKQLLETTSKEKKDLLDELARKREELDRRERNLQELESTLETKSDDIEALQEDLEDREERIARLSKELNAMNDALKNTLQSIKNALVDFDESELSVRQENGKVYVSLSQQLLFEKGSSQIGSRGREALANLAEALTKMQDLSITVEGHTDSDGSVERNWELSTERATEVVLFLQDAGLNPERMIASGRAFYQPVAPNTSEENKSLNRRTEIIINPDLEAVYNMIDNPRETVTE